MTALTPSQERMWKVLRGVKYECYAKLKDTHGIVFEQHWIDEDSESVKEAEENILSSSYYVIEYTIDEVAE